MYKFNDGAKMAVTLGGENEPKIPANLAYIVQASDFDSATIID